MDISLLLRCLLFLHSCRNLFDLLTTEILKGQVLCGDDYYVLEYDLYEQHDANI